MRIGIVAGSVREASKARRVAEWVKATAGEHDGVTFEVIDINDFDIPILTDPVMPGMANRKYASPNVTRWSQAIDGCDGYIFVTPEYNHGVPGAFKNAVDSLAPEWMGKPIAFVSYGASGGIRAVEQWRQVIGNFNMYGVRSQVELNLFQEFDAEGNPVPAERRAAEVTAMVADLLAATA